MIAPFALVLLLSPFDFVEASIGIVVGEAAVRSIVEEGFEVAMNRFNKSIV